MSPAQRRGHERRLQIQRAACRLVIARGYDGFTMDDLACEVGVSRRTLFNHVSSKEEAVLGSFVPDEQAACHDLGAASRDPAADLVEVLENLFLDAAAEDPGMLERHLMVEQAVACDARLQTMVERRFEVLTEDAASAVCARQGWPQGDLRARALARTLLSLIRLSLEEAARRQDGTPLHVIFHEVLDAARAAGVLAPVS